jgi:hypothetical protein
LLIACGVRPAPDDELLASGYVLPSPDKNKTAAVYVVESPMAFGSPRSLLRIVADEASFRPTRRAWSCVQGGISWVSWRSSSELEVVCTTTAGPSPSQRGPQSTESIDVEGVTLKVKYYRITAWTAPERGRLDSLFVDGDAVILVGERLPERERFQINARRQEVSVVHDDSLYLAVAQLDTTGTLANGVPWIGYSTMLLTPARGLDTTQLQGLPTRRIIR